MRPHKFDVHFAVAILVSFLSGCVTTNASGSVHAEVSAALANMRAAANAHDAARHVGFYARDASTILIFNGEPIVGWDTIRAKQREWWSDGKTDVVYAMQGKPEVRVLNADLAVTTLFMTSRRTRPNGEVREGKFAVSAVWQRRAEDWPVIINHTLNLLKADVGDRRLGVSVGL